MVISEENRLKRRSQYLRVYEDGKKVNQRNFVLYYLPCSEGRLFGFTVSKRIGNAVTRNRVKRRLSELVRQNMDQWPENAWYVFNAKRRIAESTFSEIDADMRRCLREIHEKDFSVSD